MEVMQGMFREVAEEDSMLWVEQDVEARLGLCRRRRVSHAYGSKSASNSCTHCGRNDSRGDAHEFVSGTSALYFNQCLRKIKPASLLPTEYQDDLHAGDIRVRRRITHTRPLSLNQLVPSAASVSRSSGPAKTEIVHVITKQRRRSLDIRVYGMQYDFRVGWKREKPIKNKDEYPKTTPLERRTKTVWSFPCPKDPLFQYDFSQVQYPGQTGQRPTTYEIEIEIRDLKLALTLQGGFKELVDRFCAAVTLLLLPDVQPNRWHFICEMDPIQVRHVGAHSVSSSIESLHNNSTVVTTKPLTIQELQNQQRQRRQRLRASDWIQQQIQRLKKLEAGLVGLEDGVDSIWFPAAKTAVDELTGEWKTLMTQDFHLISNGTALAKGATAASSSSATSSLAGSSSSVSIKKRKETDGTSKTSTASVEEEDDQDPPTPVEGADHSKHASLKKRKVDGHTPSALPLAAPSSSTDSSATIRAANALNFRFFLMSTSRD